LLKHIFIAVSMIDYYIRVWGSNK